MNKKKVYPYSSEVARQNGELDQFRESKQLNIDCAKAIDKAITDSNYELYRYDLKTAMREVLSEYGSERVSMVLANTLKCKDYDGRFSRDSKDWAKTVPLPDMDSDSRFSFIADTHPAILDGFINQVRRERVCKPSLTGRSKETASRQNAPKKEAGLEL